MSILGNIRWNDALSLLANINLLPRVPGQPRENSTGQISSSYMEIGSSSCMTVYMYTRGRCARCTEDEAKIACIRGVLLHWEFDEGPVGVRQFYVSLGSGANLACITYGTTRKGGRCRSLYWERKRDWGRKMRVEYNDWNCTVFSKSIYRKIDENLWNIRGISRVNELINGNGGNTDTDLCKLRNYCNSYADKITTISNSQFKYSQSYSIRDCY